MGDYPSFIITRHEATRQVTIDRPEARTAFTSAMRRVFGFLFTALDADGDVAAVVLTGSDPSFTAEVDLKEWLADGAPPGSNPTPAKWSGAFRNMSFVP